MVIDTRRKLSDSEIRSLAKRLRARGESRLMEDRPEQKRDLLAASRCLLEFLEQRTAGQKQPMISEPKGDTNAIDLSRDSDP